LLAVLLLGASEIYGQTITGSIIGSISDPSGLPVAGAEVSLTQANTGVLRKSKSGPDGAFVFNAVEPGAYNLSVVMSGFKKTDRTSINLTASERLSLGTIALEVGSVNESITVEAQGTAVQTASSERSGVLTGSQVDNLMIKGRNVISLLQLLPGVVDTNDPDAPNRNFGIGLSVNGNRRNSNAVLLDGMTTTDSGVGWISALNVSMDAVAEVKVLLNNYQAEYGRMRGANVMMVSKSGSRDFHGSFNYFKRHEQFNANNFFNNRLRLAKPRYRYNTYSYTIGGPIYVPGKFNKDRNKLFFFWSQEIWPQKTSTGVQRVNMPTELERAGNFSQTLDVNNRLIPITDPTTRQPFPGNIIPANRIDSNGQALLKHTPLPNFFDRNISGGQYNYLFEGEVDRPQQLHTLRGDYNPTSADMFSFTWSRQEDKQSGALGLATSSSNWPQFSRAFVTRGNLVVAKYQRVFSPTLVNEFVFGYNWRMEFEDVPQDQITKNTRDVVGFKTGQLYPSSNPLNLIPNATFGGMTNPVTLNMDNRIPLDAIYKTYNITNNITKTYSTHIFKAGVLLNRGSVSSLASVQNRGRFAFDRDVNNPLDTGFAYSNALLGTYTSYQEANRRPTTNYIAKAIEWFVQDSWRVHRRFTLELGMRFVEDIPRYSTHVITMFDPSRWDPKQEVQLIHPATVDGRRVGIDPNNGQVYPAAVIGAIAPSAGNPANGMALSSDPGYTRGLIERPGLEFSPRFGFAWDILGTGRTAVRGGFGIFHSSGSRGEGMAGSETQYPLLTTLNFNYGALPSLLTSSGLLFPQSVTGQLRKAITPASYNISFSVQHNIGFGTVVDAGYVGTLGRHLSSAEDISPVPMGANFDPKNADPTNPRVPLPATFLRPYIGYTGVTFREWSATSNYHSLQVSANRRFARGVQFGVSWTWSKNLNYMDFDDNTFSPFIPRRVWNYGMSQWDRTHVFKLNYLWDIPEVPWKDVFSRWGLNGWQVSGIISLVSGAPAGVGASFVTATDITGTPSQGYRIVVTDNPVLSKSERTFDHNFRTDVFQAPAVGTIGNAARTILRGPGINNWDIAVYKNFPIREPMKLQFRAEFYNAFNHTQFSGFDTGARFDAQGRQVNALLGQFNAARNPRQIQLAVRFTF
jgi:hypothetical protein